MKKLIVGVVVAILIAGVVVGTGVGAAGPEIENVAGPTVTVLTPVVELVRASQAVITGAGFEPGQEIRVVFSGAERGLQTAMEADINYSLDPEPIPNATGTWITAWDCGSRYIRRGLVGEGVYEITVTDVEYKALAPAVAIAFYDGEKPAEEQPAWVQTYLKYIGK